MVRLELSALPVVVQTIAQITALLAEQGYTVCAIREEARRNEHDKRAFLGSDMARLLLIQATAKGSVSITSF
ncbi:MAG TPA: hypothetical protein VHD37_00590, partial [Candidatus Paceibacterota bacterium]|nr:hypothetical protein [Candidatus Paceibacterota bacterium]